MDCPRIDHALRERGSVSAPAVGVVKVDAGRFAKGLKRNRDAGIHLVSCSIFAFLGDVETPILDRFEASPPVIDDPDMALVKELDDIQRAMGEGKLAVMVNCQRSEFVINDMGILNTAPDLGLRVANSHTTMASSSLEKVPGSRSA